MENIEARVKKIVAEQLGVAEAGCDIAILQRDDQVSGFGQDGRSRIHHNQRPAHSRHVYLLHGRQIGADAVDMRARGQVEAVEHRCVGCGGPTREVR